MRRRNAGVEVSAERHRAGLLAAAAAIVVGAAGLGFAVSGGTWHGTDPAMTAGLTDAASADAPAGTQVADDGADGETAGQQAAADTTPQDLPPQDTASQDLASQDDPAPEDATAEAAEPAGLSPDERIARATERLPAGTSNENSRALAAAIREKAESTREAITDTAFTAAIPESAAYAPAIVDKAEQEERKRALEAIRSVDHSGDSAGSEPAGDPAPREEAVAAAPSGPLVSATAKQGVNMRASPRKGAAVLLTVPANAAIQASNDCPVWCEVVYEGRRGYIYKDFIRRQQASAPAADASGGTAAAAPAEPAKAREGDGDQANLSQAAKRLQQTR